MTIGLVGRKRGMTRIFTEEGSSIPVTVVEVSPEPHYADSQSWSRTAMPPSR